MLKHCLDKQTQASTRWERVTRDGESTKQRGTPKGLVIKLRERADDTCGATEGSNPSCLIEYIQWRR